MSSFFVFLLHLLDLQCIYEYGCSFLPYVGSGLFEVFGSSKPLNQARGAKNGSLGTCKSRCLIFTLYDEVVKLESLQLDSSYQIHEMEHIGPGSFQPLL